MKDKRNRHGTVGINRLRNNIFVNPLPLPLLCEISGALHLAQPGLTAGWQTKYRCISKFSKLAVGQSIRLVASLTKVRHHYLQPYQCIPAGFSGKAYCKVDF